MQRCSTSLREFVTQAHADGTLLYGNIRQTGFHILAALGRTSANGQIQHCRFTQYMLFGERLWHLIWQIHVQLCVGCVKLYVKSKTTLLLMQ